MIAFQNSIEKQFFDQHMKNSEQAYDPAARMATIYRGKNGYHSRLSDCTVHEIHASFKYAYDLLQRDEPGDRQRAYDILYRVIPLQDMNPARDTYGIWAYYLEESLEDMNPPDWNFADFNGKVMLRMLLHCADKLTDDLKSRMADSILHACQAIIKRNMGPAYTNISVMGSYETIIAGELLHQPEIFAYGVERLRKLHAYNTAHGNFSEFNSPTYTFVVLYDLSDLMEDVQDESCHQMAQDLCNLAWETIALHFHCATGQLAGPHDRAYSFLMDESSKLAIERALDYKIRLIPDYQALLDRGIGAAYRNTLHCPEKYIPYFTGKCSERVMDQTFSPGRMAYTYMNDDFTVGSIHLEKAWNQHRNVLGYFGTVQSPIAFNLKCLHDGWDYCSALMATIQDRGRVLTAFDFLTDFGDTHVTLDMVKNATISAEDLRIRYLFGGSVQSLNVVQESDNSFLVTDQNSSIHVRIAFPYAVFGDLPVTFEITRTDDQLAIDAVLYHGVRTDLNFAQLSKAAVAAVLEISNTEISPLEVTVSESDGFLCATFHDMTVKVPLKPGKLEPTTNAVQHLRGTTPYQPAY